MIWLKDVRRKEHFAQISGAPLRTSISTEGALAGTGEFKSPWEDDAFDRDSVFISDFDRTPNRSLGPRWLPRTPPYGRRLCTTSIC